MSDLIERLNYLVSLNEPRNGGPYGGTAAEACMEAMREAATALSQEREAREKAEREVVAADADRSAARAGQAIAVRRYTSAEASLAEAKRLGGMLANAAYNIHRRGEVDAYSLRSLKEAQEAWDAALSSSKQKDGE